MKGGSAFKGIFMDMAHQWCADTEWYSSDWHFTVTGDIILFIVTGKVNTNTVQINNANSITT